MDEQVRLALAKWPNVPHCYGWLALDARGVWRMRDQLAQDLGLSGSKVTNPALCAFINRNYLADEQGRYFFQNGPQRVYVELESTPYIAHSDPQSGWVLHTGVVLEKCDAVWATKEGRFILQCGDVLAQINDRDMACVLSNIYCDEDHASDEQILKWLAESPGPQQKKLTFLFQQCAVLIQLTSLSELARSHPFVAHPK